MKAVSNSSVLIALSGIGRLELLHHRFTEGVIIPDAAWREVVETGHGRVGAKQMANAGKRRPGPWRKGGAGSKEQKQMTKDR